MAEENRAFTAASFNTYLTKEKKLVGVRCRACGTLSPEPRPVCHSCHGRNMEWYEFSGKGKLSAFTCISIVPAHMMEKGYGRDNPYCTGIVGHQDRNGSDSGPGGGGLRESNPHLSTSINELSAFNHQLLRCPDS